MMRRKGASSARESRQFAPSCRTWQLAPPRGHGTCLVQPTSAADAPVPKPRLLLGALEDPIDLVGGSIDELLRLAFASHRNIEHGLIDVPHI